MIFNISSLSELCLMLFQYCIHFFIMQIYNFVCLGLLGLAANKECYICIFYFGFFFAFYITVLLFLGFFVVYIIQLLGFVGYNFQKNILQIFLLKRGISLRSLLSLLHNYLVLHSLVYKNYPLKLSRFLDLVHDILTSTEL